MSTGLSLAIRIILLVGAGLTVIFITRKIRKAEVRLEDSILWFLLALALLFVSIFPQFFDILAQLAGVFSTTNFVFLFFIVVLLIICFNLSVRNSQAETKIKELAQEIAIEKFERHKVKTSVSDSDEYSEDSEDGEESE